MNETVSLSAIAGMIFSMIVTILGPILLLLLWRRRVARHSQGQPLVGAKAASMAPALAGALTFVIAALVLESIPKYVLFSGANAASNYILSHAWAYTLTGALLAGIFEECGRYVTMRFFLKKHTAREASITYGIGHGGIEAILLVGFGMISNLILAVMINSGTLAAITGSLPAEQATAYDAAVASLTTIGFGTFLIGIWERIFAVLLHISLSVLVFVSAKNKSRFYFLPLAIILHALLDVFAGLYQFGALPLAATELCIAALSLGCAFFACRVYRRLPK